jgi:RNA polymerase sigma-70 factor (ECF subfamily)
MISTHHDPASTPSPGLLDQLRARDRAAFATLVDHYHPIMQRVARRFVPTPAAADEVVQDTWLAVLERIDRFEERCSFKTWLFQILVNRARTTGAREARSLPVSALGERAGPGPDPAQLDRPDDDTPQSLVMRSDAVAALARAIQRLPDRQRTAVVLRDVLRLTAEEVCALLGVEDTNQRVLLHRARTSLRAMLGDHRES